MPTLLSSTSRGARRHHSSSTATSTAASMPLPAYEPPYLPLFDSTHATRIAGLADEKTKDALQEAMKLLTTAAADLSERTPSESRTDSAGYAERKALLKNCEAQMRALVDESAKLDESARVLGAIGELETVRAREAVQERRRRAAEGAGEDEEEETWERVVEVEEGVWGRYKEGVEKAVERYTRRTDREKYETKEYLDYRLMTWDAANPNKPAPKTSRLFRPDGSLAPLTTSTTAAASGGDGSSTGSDSDDDLEIAQVTENVKCPITMMYFTEPVTSTLCPHSFEKTAILDMIRKAPRGPGGINATPCPNAGCPQVLTRDDLVDNPALKRRVEQHKERLEREARLRDRASEDEDDEDEDGDGDGAREMEVEREESAVAVKKEKFVSRRKTGRPRVLDISDGDDE